MDDSYIHYITMCVLFDQPASQQQTNVGGGVDIY